MSDGLAAFLIIMGIMIVVFWGIWKIDNTNEH